VAVLGPRGGRRLIGVQQSNSAGAGRNGHTQGMRVIVGGRRGVAIRGGGIGGMVLTFALRRLLQQRAARRVGY